MNNYLLFESVKAKLSIDEICNILSVHKGTVNRWILKQEVPNSYVYDLKKILNIEESYKNKTEEEIFKSKDQFYTKNETAKYCYDKTLKVLGKLKIDYKNYTFIEPSAGNGAFLQYLPKTKRIGFDIDPKNTEVIKKDFLTHTHTHTQHCNW